MQALSNLNSQYRGKELEQLMPAIDPDGLTVEHSEIWQGVKVEIVRGKTRIGSLYALRITMGNKEWRFVQNENITLAGVKLGSVQHSTWLYEHRYLPVMALGLRVRDELHPANLKEFHEFTVVLNCHYMTGEATVGDVGVCLHYMIDSMEDRGLLKMEGAAAALREGVSKLTDELTNRAACMALHPSLNHEIDRIKIAGHAVAIVPGAHLGCAQARELERAMLDAAYEYLSNNCARFPRMI